MVSSYRKSAVDTIFIGVATIIQFLVGLFTMPLISKTMGAEGYGIWVQVGSAISLIIPITNLGLAGSLVRFLAAEKRRQEIQEGFYSVAFTLFFVNLIVGLIVILLAGPIASHFFGGMVQVVRITGVLVIIVTLVENYLILLRTFQQVKTISLFTIFDICLMTGLIAFLVLRGYGISSVVYAYLAIKSLELVFLFFLLRTKLGFKWPRFSRLKEFLVYGLPLMPRGAAFWFINVSDRYIISFFLGIAAVGIYSAGYGLGNIPYSVSGVLTYVMMATLPQLYDENKLEEVKTHLSYTLKYFLAIAIPFIFGTFIVGEPVLALFSTPDIAEKGHIVVPLNAIGMTILSIHNIILNILFLVKKTKILIVTWVTAAIISLGLNLALIPSVGIIGAAVSSLTCYSLATIVVGYFAFKEFTFYIDWRFIVKSLVSSAVMLLALRFIHFDGRFGVVYAVLISIVIYWTILVLIRGFSRSEFKFFWGLLTPKK